MKTQTAESKATAPPAPLASAARTETMQIHTSKSQLVRAIAASRRVTGKTSSTLPILNHVRLSASGDHLTASGTDLDTEVQRSVAVTVLKPGAFLVPAGRLLALLNGLPEGDVTLTAAPGSLTVAAGSSNYKFPTLAAADWPNADRQEIDGPRNSASVQSTAFKNALKSVAFCSSTDDTRHVLQGVFFTFNHERQTLTLVATDGRRLSERHCEAGIIPVKDGERAAPTSAIIPTGVIKEVLNAIEDEQTLTITITDRRATFAVEDTVIHSKIIEGVFPNYRQIIPAHTDRTTLNPKDLAASLRRIHGAVLTEKNLSVRCEFAGLELKLTGKSAEYGEAVERHSTSGFKDLAIAFNPEYLAQALESVEGDEITLLAEDELSPLILRQGEKWLHVLMPLRLG